VDLRQHAQIPVVAAAGRGGQTLGYFGLHQEHRARPQGRRREDAIENRRGYVVRQIAGHYGGAPLGQIRLQDIAFDQREAAGFDSVAKLLAEIVNQDRVDFNSYQAGGSLQQARRQRATAGSNLDGYGSAGRASRGGDAFQGRLTG